MALRGYRRSKDTAAQATFERRTNPKERLPVVNRGIETYVAEIHDQPFAILIFGALRPTLRTSFHGRDSRARWQESSTGGVPNELQSVDGRSFCWQWGQGARLAQCRPGLECRPLSAANRSPYSCPQCVDFGDPSDGALARLDGAFPPGQHYQYSGHFARFANRRLAATPPSIFGMRLQANAFIAWIGASPDSVSCLCRTERR